MGLVAYKNQNLISILFFSLPFFVLFAGSFIVLGLYVYLYRALNKTLNELAKFVTELQSPKNVRVSEVKQVEKEKQVELDIRSSKRLLDSFNQRDF